MIPAKGKDKMTDVWYDRSREVEAKYNWKIDYVFKAGTNHIHAFNTSAMAGAYYADAIYGGAMHAFQNRNKNNSIVPLDDYIGFTSGHLEPNVRMQQYLGASIGAYRPH
jgi:hypothetical protein